MLNKVLTILGTFFLFVSLLAVGFALCSAQPTTRLLSTAFSNFDNTPYAHADLIDLAVATRDYTVDDHKALEREKGSDAPAAQLAHVVVEAAASNAEAADHAGAWADIEVPAPSDAAALSDEEALDAMYALAAVSDAYALDADAMSHLKDCNDLIRGVIPWLWGFAAAALVCLVVLAVRKSFPNVAGVLIAGPALLLAALVGCGIWAAIDFNSFFGMFHAVLFPQGNWTFSYDSLLITMLPLAFWVCMGVIWLAGSGVACIITFICGLRLRKRVRATA